MNRGIGRPYIYIASLIYLCGFSVALYYSYSQGKVIESFNIVMKEPLYLQLIGDKPHLLIHIFRNNIKVLLINYFGALSFGLIACVYLFYNSIVFGFVLGATLQTSCLNDVLPYILPHSFEIIPIVGSAAEGMLFGKILFCHFFLNKETVIDYKFHFKKFIFYIVLLLLAALCETYISIH